MKGWGWGFVPWGKGWGGKGWMGGKGKGGGKGGSKIATVPDDFTFDNEARYTGKVTYYNKWKGYGFAELDQKGVVPEDRLFVHWRNIQSEDRFPFLTKDMQIEFGLMKWKEGKSGRSSLRAKTITAPNKQIIALQDSVDAEKKSFVGGQDLRYTGTLKFYDPKGGYGYVTIDEGFQLEEGIPKELRVERAEVNSGGKQPGPMENIGVEFGIWKTRRDAYKVYNMTLPGGVPLSQAQLENRVTQQNQTYQGEVKIWNWRQGWGFIKAAEGSPIPATVLAKLAEQTQAAQSKAESKGKTSSQDQLLYFRRQDCSPGVRISQDMKVTFSVYTDDKGAGACDVEAAEA
eukprot:TRINITY_DN7203_c0_g1_i1.p1 TRINITY_DN7203_c0_g1~~TRINITY_DN7203_c0_g1_i1.p1  ORF type:complete len:344 (+),score=94.26 TRINITY_DN7203_c0_g1_i1:62-1093(+)